jgi:D-arabinose 1-dehydrogenase-like Zn-dependent alcohol dehydrogenase
MKAMVLRAPNTPFVLEERPDPKAGQGEAVARVFACGAGLTIEHIRAGRAPATFPRVIGHEISAEIVDVGPGVSELRVGDPVTCYFYSPCGHCRWCRENRATICVNQGPRVGYQIDGGYAELIKLPAANFLKLPPGLDHKGKAAEVGVIVDALATPFEVVRHAKVRPLEQVAVVGAGGGLGIHMIMVAKWAGARVIAVERSAAKFDACRQAGADAVVDAGGNDVVGALLDATGGSGADLGIDIV